MSKYSLVCDSSTPPISFLIGGFISEYLVVLGAILISLDAYVEIYFPSFDASLCLVEVSIVVCLNSFFLNPRFCNLSKISENELVFKGKGMAWEEEVQAYRQSY